MSTIGTSTSTSNLNSGYGLGVSGLASGFDWHGLVDQLVSIERAPEQLLQQQQTTLNQKNVAYGAMVTELNLLKNRADALNDSNLFDGRQASVDDDTAASASASAGAPTGAYTFHFTQLATAGVLTGGSQIAGPLSATDAVDTLVLSTAPFSTAVTAGTFTVNGNAVTLDTTDTLQQVFDKISAATGGAVTGSYDHAADKITLSSGSEIVLGSGADTSNFLQVARLFNSGTGTVTSSSTLGALQGNANLDAANLGTTIDDGGSGNGAFTINGVTINFNAATDSLNNVIQRINSSAAGVIAAYDSFNQRLTLTDKNTGDIGMTVQDVTGNFLAATGLSAGSLQRGNNLVYTINGGAPMTSQSNTITSDSSGIAGLSVTALKEGVDAAVTVANDTSSAKSAIADFITEYNKVQSLIDSDTAITVDSSGKVSTALLSNERDVSDMASQLRNLVFSQVSGLSGTIQQLAALGYDTNGQDNSIALKDSAALDDALQNHVSEIKALFQSTDTGIAARLGTYLTSMAGDNGTLVAKQTTLQKQSADLDTQIANVERMVQQKQQTLIAEFTAMEDARARINQQMVYLTQQFGGGSSTSSSG